MSSVEIILTVLGSAGGTGVIIAALSAWLGKVCADRLAQLQKLSGEIDLDPAKTPHRSVYGVVGGNGSASEVAESRECHIRATLKT